jgi:adenine-specific DNA-methyltransferase
MKENEMETKINQEIHTALKQFEDRYFIGGIINKQRVIQDLYSYDSELIAAMLNSDLLKENFTMQVADITIFQINNLIELFEADEFWKDSYTKYSKKIGLTSGGKFIDESTDVVLDFPYKDTVLKASMSKEDTDKEDLRPEEPFLNEVIAKEEIDVLLDKKIFVNAKRYNSEGEEEIEKFHDDNLIIKGNNLLALHTIKGKYTEKVKLVYIDPPYNTGKDGFQYNDRFNRSSWLVFMKNRLEIAKQLLSNEGVIFVQITDKEGAYLKVLMDNVFGEENFVAQINWKKRGGAPNDKVIGATHEYILLYSKNNEMVKIYQKKRSEEQLSRYKNPDNHPKGRWAADNLMANVKGGRFVQSLYYPILNPSTGEEFYPSSNGNWRYNKEKMSQLLKNDEIYFSADGKGRPKLKRFLNDLKGGVPYSTIWDDLPMGNSGTSEILNLFGSVNEFDTPKPEGLLKQIVALATVENDIVLDFFMGSATTLAVAMKMNRKFIGIEQMDYINTISIPRLQKVIESEQGGISKEVNWKGGGSFVYAELMEKNSGFLKSIISASSMTELQEIFSLMLETADFEFQVDLNEARNTIWQLPVEDQKRILIKIIDKNQLYYNYSEIEDANVRDLISDTDYAFNKSFYAERGE